MSLSDFFEKHKAKLGFVLGSGIVGLGLYYILNKRKNHHYKIKKVVSEEEQKEIISHIQVNEKDGYILPDTIIAVHKAIMDITIFDQSELIYESREKRRHVIKDIKQYTKISEDCHHKINELKHKTQCHIITELKIDNEVWEKSIIRCHIKKNEEVIKFIEGEYDIVYSTFQYKHISTQELQIALQKAKEIADAHMAIGLDIKKSIKDDKVYQRVCRDWVFDMLFLKHGYEEEQLIRGLNLNKEDEDMQDLMIDIFSSLNMWSLQEIKDE